MLVALVALLSTISGAEKGSSAVLVFFVLKAFFRPRLSFCEKESSCTVHTRRLLLLTRGARIVLNLIHREAPWTAPPGSAALMTCVRITEPFDTICILRLLHYTFMSPCSLNILVLGTLCVCVILGGGRCLTHVISEEGYSLRCLCLLVQVSPGN